MKTQSKAQFINSQPADMAARDVVKAGRKAGLKFSQAYVYVARSMARKAVQKPKGARVPDDIRQQFATLALRIGLDRAEAELRRLQRGLDVV